MRIFSILLALASILSACKTPQSTVSTPPSAGETADPLALEKRLLDTLFVTAPRIGEEESLQAPEEYSLSVYNPSSTRVNDLLHTRLDLKFDWDNEKVLGKATLKLKPFFYPTDSVVLDAKDFEFHKVVFQNSDAPLKYRYDEQHITIDLGRTFTRDENYTIYIEYTAAPSQTGGSAAITSDQGLFFIKPNEENPDKPMQIWTQGETNWNSRWFPTIDHPNERTTQEMLLTVDQRFRTLSNGVLASSKNNPDGTRTDHWKLDQPHAPYLFMIAVGEYAVVTDHWEGIPVEYWVEPEFEDDARAIFSHTVEMLEFFSDILGMKYPWPKYSQIVVRDYVSGAMENTTSVIYGEFVQRKKRDLIDNTNEGIVAHELFHHWFGDLVTCESWANLTMNEGFANYAEYLWFEHKYGRDEADYHLLNEWSEYIGASRSGVHPLIHFGYGNNEDMFDSHSYNKGGAVLHMLRNFVGDEAFFKSLNRYLTQHKYTAVEAHDLRLAFEAVTGQDLNWFFNQWYFSSGHPSLNITYDYDEEGKSAAVAVEQTQDAEIMPPIFQMPVAIDIYTGSGSPTRHNIWVNERQQSFTFPVAGKPRLINFDAERALLAEIEDNKTEEEYVFQFYNAPKFFDRFEAVQELVESELPEARQVLTDALNDPHWIVRGVAIRLIDEEVPDESVLERVREMAADDPHSYVRSMALDLLTNISDEGSVPSAIKAVKQDSAYHVISSGLYLLFLVAPDTAAVFAEQLIDDDNYQILEVVEIVLGESGDPKYLPFYEKRIEDFDGMSALSFFGHYQQLAAAADPEKAMDIMRLLKGIGVDMEQSQWRRVSATKAIHDMREHFRERTQSPEAISMDRFENYIKELSDMIAGIKAAETDEEVINIYKQLQID
jgi:aminopeptidase N